MNIIEVCKDTTSSGMVFETLTSREGLRKNIVMSANLSLFRGPTTFATSPLSLLHNRASSCIDSTRTTQRFSPRNITSARRDLKAAQPAFVVDLLQYNPRPSCRCITTVPGNPCAHESCNSVGPGILAGFSACSWSLNITCYNYFGILPGCFWVPHVWLPNQVCRGLFCTALGP